MGGGLFVAGCSRTVRLSLQGFPLGFPAGHASEFYRILGSALLVGPRNSGTRNSADPLLVKKVLQGTPKGSLSKQVRCSVCRSARDSGFYSIASDHNPRHKEIRKQESQCWFLQSSDSFPYSFPFSHSLPEKCRGPGVTWHSRQGIVVPGDERRRLRTPVR